MLRTTDATRRALEHDGLAGGEGAFPARSFWLAECLARQGRVAEARAVIARASATGNDLGLFAEECDPRTGELLGKFPQGLNHPSHLAAAVALVASAGAPGSAAGRRLEAE